MSTVYVDGIYIGKAKNLGKDWTPRLLDLPLEGLRA